MIDGSKVPQYPTGHPVGLSSPPTSSMDSQSSGGSQKRSRGEDEGPSQPVFVQVPIPTTQAAPHAPPEVSSVTPKKFRTCSYKKPRTVRPSILSAMGSLVGGGHGDANSSVPVRRRLSGGHLEEYIGGHDTMEMDTADSRPRSMSF
jgi:hypothetical protein